MVIDKEASKKSGIPVMKLSGSENKPKEPVKEEKKSSKKSHEETAATEEKIDFMRDE